MGQSVYELTQLESLRVLGALVRSRLGIWFGLLDPGGRVLPLGAGGTDDGPRPCRALDVRGDAHGSCTGSVRLWSERARQEGGSCPQDGACHAGLDALLWPLVVDGKVVGTLYASGFWAEKARSHRLERRLKALGLPKAEALGDVPILTASDRAWV
ncbi:MAG: PocR ligand-binding domain-containing protein, partial [Myxococcota bacterium]